MQSTVKNHDYSVNMIEILTNSLKKVGSSSHYTLCTCTYNTIFISQGSFSDVVLSVPGTKKVVKCHKSVLSKCSLFLSSLLSNHETSEEPIHIIVVDTDFNDLMAMLNIIYVGQ